MEKCDVHSDQWANEVLVRVEGAVSDLHAADARYHYDCKTNFMAPKSVQLAAAASSTISDASVQGDPAYEQLVCEMSTERSKIRNSSEIYKEYESYGGMMMSRRALITALLTKFEDDLLIFRAAGIASILVFRDKATDIFGLIADDSEDDVDQAIKTVVKQVKSETDMIS